VPAMKRSVTVSVGGLAKRTLAGDSGGDEEHAAKRAERAIRAYLGGKEEGRAGWEVPGFAGREPAERVDLSLSLDEELWAAVEVEAAAQGVTVDQLVAHAVLYYAAEIDAGEITQRILERLDDEG